MDKFATLEPTKLYPTSLQTTTKRLSATGFFNAQSPPVQVFAASKPPAQYIGKLPAHLHVLIVAHLPIPDIARYARASRTTSRVARDDILWERRWLDLGVQKFGLATILDELEVNAMAKQNATTRGPATLVVSSLDDDFGDFTSASPRTLFDLPGSLSTADTYVPGKPTPTFRAKYIRAHTLLLPLLPAPNAPSHAILASLTSCLPSPPDSPAVTPSLPTQARVLHLLARFLSPVIKPVSTWDLRLASLRASLDKFDASLLTAFDAADTQGDEARMKETASASWEISICMKGVGQRTTFVGPGGDWEMGRLWAEKREILYEQGKWDSSANFRKDTRLDFTAMDGFMSHVIAAVENDGARAFRVFPPESGVLLTFAERIANDVLSEYISSLLARARTLNISLFLSATAACFREGFRIVDSILTVSGSPDDGGHKGESEVVKRTQAEDIIYRMFEPNMVDYLDDEMEELKRAFDTICREWERSASLTTSSMVVVDGHVQSPENLTSQAQTRFLDSQNPALMKRNVLASFTDVLLLPVTIVPRAVGAGVGVVGAGVGAVGSGVVQGISMLNPQRWMGSGSGIGVSETTDESPNGYESFGKDGALFEVGEDKDDEADEDVEEEGETRNENVEGGVDVDIQDEAGWGEIAEGSWQSANGVANRDGFDGTPEIVSTQNARTFVSTSAPVSTKDSPNSFRTTHNSVTPSGRSQASPRTSVEALDLLLSLDVSLQLIHATRDAMKRLETFAAYPGTTGTRVRQTLDDAFCEMLGALSSRHIARGFGIASERMSSYRPSEHEGTMSVAPLVQFFELVHIGDMIQSMVQVFFDKEMAPHIDKTDFLNAVVREKKRLENTLDDCVASGLNAGTQVLMNQVDHIIQSVTPPRAYYPSEDTPLDLRPTEGCREAIRCLEMHCKLLKGSTSREVLEVFYQEVGIRLLAILQKHIKRQIVSLNGGFQVIADLNAYHAFIASLKVSNITADFDHLKMLGHVFVVEDAKDLAQIVRDVTRYGGAYRPEDIYEFIQRRSDWKKIEKAVDKTMYNLSFKEDCVVF